MEAINKKQIPVRDSIDPMIGFGTYPLQGSVCENAVKKAFEEGYRWFDTATAYNNFDPIAKALSQVGRAEILMTSKVWPNSQEPTKLLADLNKTLEQLKISYLDHYLLHWPDSTKSLPDIITTFKKILSEGLVRAVGLSNVNIHHVKKAIDSGMPVSIIQNEMNPYFCDFELLNFCNKNKIIIQAWAPLGRGRINECDYILSIAEKYHKTPAQIALRWIIQLGCIPFPGSKNPKHIHENFSIKDFELTQSDMEFINAKAALGQRERVTLNMGFGISDEFDYTYDECWP